MSIDLSKLTNSSGAAKSKDSGVGIGAAATRSVAYIYARLPLFLHRDDDGPFVCPHPLTVGGRVQRRPQALRLRPRLFNTGPNWHGYSDPDPDVHSDFYPCTNSNTNTHANTQAAPSSSQGLTEVNS
jgi:hypothetical protein